MSNSQSHTFMIAAESQGVRLDRFLATHLQDLSRSRIQSLIQDGYVSINQQPFKDASFKVKEGQTVDIIIPPAIEALPIPQDIELDILYEDDDVIVINKSAGMVVHPAPGNPQNTLVNALLSHCGESLSGIGGVRRPGIVHRLDKETSGLLVAAKNDKAHHNLAQQLATREMRRVYVALVWGMITPSEGTIEGPIARDVHHRQRMTIRTGGKFARTHYKVLKHFGRLATLVECKLDTGRTHQIRVHLSKKGFPVIGDPLYGKEPKAVPTTLKDYLKLTWTPSRQALHAKELSFIHPSSHKKLDFTVDLPQDMIKLTDVLESQVKLT